MTPTRPPLMVLGALAGLLSALLIIFAVYPLGPTALLFLPGAAFGALLALGLFLFGALSNLGKGIALVIAFSLAYYLSVQAAFAVELYSPFGRPENEHGALSNLTLFVGGFVGAFLVLSAASLLLNSQLAWQRRLLHALYWSPVGGILGILGWALGPSLGMAIWSVAHSLHLNEPTETAQSALGQSGHLYSLWVVWQTGIGILLGLVMPAPHAAPGN
jgi:hypothetical protein